MANMSYWRFRNTLNDLRDCYDNMDNDVDMNKDEFYARRHLIVLCMSLASEYVYLLDQDFEGMFIDDEEWEKENGR